VADRAHELVALDQALTKLESLSDRPARVVELRFFGGLSVEETAAVMEVSERTVKREWQKARAFLFDALRRDGLG
jgi:RNA polymerase sigma factor (sigma-70 family)